MIQSNLRIALLGIAFFVFQMASAQSVRKCGTTEMNNKLINSDKSILKTNEILEKNILEYLKNKQSKDTKNLYIIPVVFHIVHDNGPENIPKSSILRCVEQMNEDFSATNGDISSVIPEFQNIIGNATIEFRLAKIDPDGNCTEGITRTHSLATYGALDNVKYIAAGWPRSQYLNIWVVRSLGLSAAAYAYYPGSVNNSPSIDGILTSFHYVGNTGSGKHTISHEVGHCLNLMHPWGNSNDPGLPTNCQIDDNVEDTPLTIGTINGTCNLSQTTCSSLDNVQNIMDYSGCDRMFTIGQVDRMHATLNSSISQRNNLWAEDNLLATGTNDGYNADPCEPIADFIYNPAFGCEGFEINFSDFSYNTKILSRHWNFPGGEPSESTDSVVTVYYDYAGDYSVTLQVTANSGTDEITKNNVVFAMDTLTGFNMPVHEDFEDASFPVNNEDNSKSWTIVNQGSGFWEYNNDASTSGEGSVRIKNYFNGDGTKNKLISPNINLAGINEGVLSFNYAYTKRHISDADELRIYISGNCGVNWRLIFAKSGSSLSPVVGTTPYIPEINDWENVSLDFYKYIDWNHMQVKFEMLSYGGNYLYIDDVIIQEASSVKMQNNEELLELKIFPNPINESSVIEFELLHNSNIEFNISTIYGKRIVSDKSYLPKGKNEYKIRKLFEEINPGVYLVTITTGNKSITRKFIKMK